MRKQRNDKLLLSSQDKKLILAMVQQMIPMKGMAQALGLSLSTFQLRIAEDEQLKTEMLEARAKALTEIYGKAFKLAKEGNPGMIKYLISRADSVLDMSNDAIKYEELNRTNGASANQRISIDQLPDRLQIRLLNAANRFERESEAIYDEFENKTKAIPVDVKIDNDLDNNDEDLEISDLEIEMTSLNLDE